MKFYLITILVFFCIIHITFGQNRSIDDNKSEVTKLNTESLQMEVEVDLYPNPASDFLNVTLKNSQLKNVEFEVYNIIGNKMEFEIDAVNADNYKLNVKEFHSGYYLLILKDPVSRFNKAYKFRKQ
jgi:hypothetical protein